MNILIIYCHPSNKSYTYEILQQLIAMLERERHTVQVSDLEAMNFKSEMSAKSMSGRDGPIFSFLFPEMCRMNIKSWHGLTG